MKIGQLVETYSAMSLKSTEKSKGFEYAIQLTRILLMPLGLWPSKSLIYKRILRPMAIGFCLFFMFFVIIPLVLFTFVAVKDLRIRLKSFGPLGFAFMSLFKYIVAIIKDEEIASCFLKMSIDWQKLRNPTEHKIMVKNAKTGRILTIICVIFMFGGGGSYSMLRPIIKGAIVRGNDTIRLLGFPSYFIFFDPQIRPIWDYVFTAQVICGLTRYFVTSGVYSIAIISIMHICSQVSITSLTLKNLPDNFDYRLLGQIIEQHLGFLKFSSKLEYIFNKICLVEIIGSTFIICLLGYYLVTDEQKDGMMDLIAYLLLLTSFVFNIFILCYIGQILTEQCQNLGTNAYMIHWYKLSGKEAKNLLLLVLTTQRPVFLTAGKMINLSLESFTDVMKASASYLNMLRQVTASGS